MIWQLLVLWIDWLLESDDWLICIGGGSQQCSCLQLFILTAGSLFRLLPKEIRVCQYCEIILQANIAMLQYCSSLSTQIFWQGRPQRWRSSHSVERSMAAGIEERQGRQDLPNSTKYSHLLEYCGIMTKERYIWTKPAALNTWLGMVFGTSDLPWPLGPTQPNWVLGPTEKRTSLFHNNRSKTTSAYIAGFAPAGWTIKREGVGALFWILLPPSSKFKPFEISVPNCFSSSSI